MTPLTLYWCFSHFYSNQRRYTRYWLHRKWIHFHYVYKMTVQIGFEKQISFAQCTSSQISNPPPTSTPWAVPKKYQTRYTALDLINPTLHARSHTGSYTQNLHLERNEIKMDFKHLKSVFLSIRSSTDDCETLSYLKDPACYTHTFTSLHSRHTNIEGNCLNNR